VSCQHLQTRKKKKEKNKKIKMKLIIKILSDIVEKQFLYKLQIKMYLYIQILKSL